MNNLEESSGRLIDMSEIRLSAMDREISELKKKIRELEAAVSNDREKHMNEIKNLKALLYQMLKGKQLQERPPTNVPCNLWKTLKNIVLRCVRSVEDGDTRRVTKVDNTASKTTPLPTGRGLVFVRKAKAAKFSIEDLLNSSAEVLGKGTFGTTYKATFESTEVIVAVKRFREVHLSERKFRKNVAQIGKLEHKNIVPLLGYYCSKGEKLLVYDFMAAESLSTVLHGSKISKRTPLRWETRARITLQVAHGIHHIHSRDPKLSHGNINSSNILLTPTHEAYLSDYGIYTLATPQTSYNSTTIVHYTHTGYQAPEIITNSKKISQKADVYSFGVLVLELMTGKKPETMLTEQRVELPRWVKYFPRGWWKGRFDQKILESYHDVSREGLFLMMQLGIDCTVRNPVNRPSMEDVVVRMKEIILKYVAPWR